MPTFFGLGIEVGLGRWYNINMEQKQGVSNQAKINTILKAIDRNKRFLNRGTESGIQFSGKIGDDGLTFTGEFSWNPQQYHLDNRVDIDLKNYKKDLATITIEHAGPLPFFSNLLDNLNYHHEIKILTPAWYGKTDAKTGGKTNLNEKGQASQVQVWHARNKAAEDVIDEIYHVVERSLTKVKIINKLKELDLPNLPLRAAAENLVNMMYHNQSQDHGRGR